MNDITFSSSSDLYNMILGGLISLTSAQDVGKVNYHPVSETIFLAKWLKRIKKQKRYPKTVAKEIDGFLELYTSEGRSAGLAALFHKMYTEFQLVNDTKKQYPQSAKTRFELAMNTLQENGWHTSLPINHDPITDKPYRPQHKREVFTTKWYWKNAFDEQGHLTKSLSIFVVSQPQQVIDDLHLHGFILVKGASSKDEEGNSYVQFILFPDNNCTGEAAIPTKFLS